MKISTYFLLLFLLLSNEGLAQSKYSIFKNVGFSYNPSIEFKETTVQKSKGYFVEVGLNYQLFEFNSSTIEIGLAGKTIFASGAVNRQSFNATTFRITAPLKWIFPIPNTKLQVVNGLIFQNNVDFQEFDLRLRDKYSWRMNYLLGVQFQLKKQAALTLGGNFNLRKIPDVYFINDPKIAFTIGFRKGLFFKKNRNKK